LRYSFDLKSTAHDHRLGPESRGDGRHASTIFSRKNDAGIGVAARGALDRGLQLRRQLGPVDAGARMHADLVVDDEFKPRQADAGIRQLREAEGESRDCRCSSAILTGIFGSSPCSLVVISKGTLPS
jgi:hypothetical protein